MRSIDAPCLSFSWAMLSGFSSLSRASVLTLLRCYVSLNASLPLYGQALFIGEQATILSQVKAREPDRQGDRHGRQTGLAELHWLSVTCSLHCLSVPIVL